MSSKPIDLDWLRSKIEYRRFQECVHCGLCTASCPTYIETANENDSPRGRIYLMRAVVDGRLDVSDEVREHLHLCLDCRACESACPSGVGYGRLIEPFKVALSRDPSDVDRASWLERLLLHHVFPSSRRVRWSLAPVRVLHRLGLRSRIERGPLRKLLPGVFARMAGMLPERLEPWKRLPEALPPIGPRRARVALFTGCVADAMFPATTAATARVLQQNGCEVIVPRAQVCCGAIHYHSGAEAPAIELARRNLATFRAEDYDAIIVNAAGCGAMLRDYHHLLPPEDRPAAERFVARVRDIAEFLVGLGAIAPQGELKAKVTYHDACHLCHAQQVRAQPRELLAMVPGVDLVPLAESEICCGAAGTYNLTEPEMSDRLAARKVEHIEATGADVVAMGNVGCILQIARALRERGSPIRVAHTVELLDQAYRSAKNEGP